MAKQPISSNLQGLENEQRMPSGEPNERIIFDANQSIDTPEHHPTGEIIKEKSDLVRLQDEDFRSRVQEIELGQIHITKNNDDQTIVSVDDPAVRPDAKPGRLNLSIRYDNERSQFIVQIIDAQGIIRPEQVYAPDMCLIFSLIRNEITDEEKEKHTRVFVIDEPKQWKEPVRFSIAYDKIIQEKLHILARNDTDPSAPRDREIIIPLNDLKQDGKETNNWFDLQFVQSTH